MSVLEIKHQIERLTPDEQSQLESFLNTKRLGESPEFRGRVTAAHRRFDAGEAISSAQLRELLGGRATSS